MRIYQRLLLSSLILLHAPAAMAQEWRTIVDEELTLTFEAIGELKVSNGGDGHYKIRKYEAFDKGKLLFSILAESQVDKDSILNPLFVLKQLEERKKNGIENIGALGLTDFKKYRAIYYTRKKPNESEEQAEKNLIVFRPHNSFHVQTRDPVSWTKLVQSLDVAPKKKGR